MNAYVNLRRFGNDLIEGKLITVHGFIVSGGCNPMGAIALDNHDASGANGLDQ
jgi:hypothetical protein